MRETLTAAEKAIMETTFKAAMLRAADIIDRITERDVAEAQIVMHREGVKLEDLTKIDRARLASAHLRAIAQLGKEARVSTEDLKKAVARG